MIDDYDKLLELENKALNTYQHKSIGKTMLNRKIYCYTLGEGDAPPILIQGGIHAREYITSFLIFRMMDYLSCFSLSRPVIFVPIVNKDGIEMCIKGSQILRTKIICQKKLLSKNNQKNTKNSEKTSKITQKRQKNIEKIKIMRKYLLSHFDKNGLKCNARGVDLNVNFDIDWGQGTQNFFGYNYLQNYVGSHPFSESESCALARLSRQVMPMLTLSYHSKGEVFYYGYKGENVFVLSREKLYKKIIKSVTQYRPVFTKNSSGGFKDYCEMVLSIPSFTIEVGSDDLLHPIPSHCLDEIFARNRRLVIELLKKM